MALKDLAYTKAEQKERNSPKGVNIGYPGSSERYPYGLRIDLNNDVMQKLGLKSLPKTGTEVYLTACAKVVSTAVNDRDGKTEKRMELQITSMEIDEEEESAEDAIFGGMDEEDDEE
jgi:hypothetical protein